RDVKALRDSKAVAARFGKGRERGTGSAPVGIPTPMKFVKLTQSVDGKNIWINMSTVDSMRLIVATEISYTLLVSSGEEVAAVEETPEEIIAKCQ
ncbi:MAG: hypothetical protein EBS01_07320, partial [Verrucomicrobia bacterium]|nr:hypothetical protein [Verrucomicrobiota bacterium]